MRIHDDDDDDDDGGDPLCKVRRPFSQRFLAVVHLTQKIAPTLSLMCAFDQFDLIKNRHPPF